MKRLSQIDVPSTLAGVLQARLDSLPRHERTVLQQASVVGRLFWDRIVSYIQGEAGDGHDPELISLALTSLRNRELVYRHEESAFLGAVEYLFKHDVLREVTYESVLKRLRRTYHGLIADWLIGNSGDRIGEYSGLIAEHLVLAGRKEQACKYYLQAGEYALLSYANQEAETQFRSALSLECTEIDKPKLLEVLGDSLTSQGHNEEAIQSWNQAIELNLVLDDRGNVARLYAKSSRAAWWSGDPPQGLEICLKGLNWIEDKPDSHDVALLLHETGRAYHFNGKPNEALEYCQKALQMADRLDDIEVQADTLATLGVLPRQSPESALDALTRAVDLAEKGNFLNIGSRANTNLGVVRYVKTGDIFNSREDYKRALTIDKRRGDLHNELFTFNNLWMLDTEWSELSEIERGLRILENRAEEILATDMAELLRLKINAYLLALQGEFQRSLALLNDARIKAGECGDLQELDEISYQIILSNIAMHRSGGEPNWQEVELVLNELIDLGETGFPSQASPFALLSIAKTLQGDFLEAHQNLEAAKEGEFDYSPFWNNISISRATAYLAAAEGRWGESFAAYEDLVETFSQKGYRWKHAHTLCDWGDGLVSRGETADLEAARKLYNQSIEIYDDLEASWYRKQVEKRLAQIT
jgi:tetratricopeptide (TPR) repeat protein